MKALVTTLIAIIMSLLVSSCSLQELSQIAPTPYEQQEYERQISRSVRRAVKAPGIDNGSTIIVTMEGDTLVAPRDTTLKASQIRTVYVDIKPPVYPKGINRRSIEILLIITTVSIIGAVIFIILIGVFIVIIRRMNGRNKNLRMAIDQAYPLPESFYTGVPSAAPITINRYSEKIVETPSEPNDPSPAGGNAGSCPPPPFEQSAAHASGKRQSFSETIDSICSVGPNRARDLRNSVLLIGMGLIIFVAFMAERAGMIAFLGGGSLFMLGLAKLLSIYLSRKL